MCYTKSEGFFKSSDSKNDIAYYIYTPVDVIPRGIIQISHGMMENIGRFESEGFIREMCSAGFVVCGNDHLGHGNSLKSEKDSCYFSDYKVLSNDLHIMYEIIREKYKFLPLILFGHSMGSFIARDYITKYNEIDGCILNGTSGKNGKVGLGIAFTSLLSLLCGGRFKSKLITALSFADYYKKFDIKESIYVWQSSDKGVQKRLEEMKASFPVASYREMFKVLKTVNQEDWYYKVPQSLSMLLIAGEDDPVGNYGLGVKEVYKGLEEREIFDLKMILIAKGRHEPYNDVMRSEYYRNVIGWCNELITGVVEMRTGKNEVYGN